MRYLPNRPDVREQVYSKRRQLNYVSADEALPGDILVFDAGGDTRSAVSGDAALAKTEFEEFQRSLLLEGRSMDGVYPPSEETRREYERQRESRR